MDCTSIAVAAAILVEIMLILTREHVLRASYDLKHFLILATLRELLLLSTYTGDDSEAP